MKEKVMTNGQRYKIIRLFLLTLGLKKVKTETLAR